jgi:hypothetical protein
LKLAREALTPEEGLPGDQPEMNTLQRLVVFLVAGLVCLIASPALAQQCGLAAGLILKVGSRRGDGPLATVDESTTLLKKEA